MPEGDTIYRTAATLERWIGGREVTAARTKVLGLGIDRIVGHSVTEVSSQGKHLLVYFSNGLALHSHMRMTGSWHLYSSHERWRKPSWQAKVVLESSDRVAVCFNAPVVEMLTSREEARHVTLTRLGPDVLGGFDLGDIQRRVAARDDDTTIGELLLDQRVVAGIGNIYRCESLFLDAVNPWTRKGRLSQDEIGRLIETARHLMRCNIGEGGDGRALRGRWVYKRAGRPCRRCRTSIKAGRIGALPRVVYWCPTCQPA